MNKYQRPVKKDSFQPDPENSSNHVKYSHFPN